MKAQFTIQFECTLNEYDSEDVNQGGYEIGDDIGWIEPDVYTYLESTDTTNFKITSILIEK